MNESVPLSDVNIIVPQDAVPSAPIEFNPFVQLGRSGLKQYGGFIFEEFINVLRGKQGAEAYKEVVENSALVGGIYRLIELSLRQINFFVEPFSEDPADQQRAVRLDGALQDMSDSWEDVVSEIATMIIYGYAPMELVYKKCNGWSEDPTQRSRYSDGLIAWRKIALRSQDTLFRWNFDADGGVRAMIQLPPPDYVMRTIPIEKLLLFRPRVSKGNPEGNSVLRSGMMNWHMIKRLTEYEAIAGERDVTGVPVAWVPASNMGPNATPGQQAVVNQFKKVVTNVRIDDQMGLVLPLAYDPLTKQPLYKLELLSATGRGQHFDFNQVITRHEVRLAMSMLADVAMLGHDKVGSFALAKDKRTMLADGMGAWADAICAVFSRHAFPRFFAMNGWPMDRMPKLGHGDIQGEDIAVLSTAAMNLSRAGMALFPDDLLENHIRAEAGWPQKTLDTGVDTSDSGDDIDSNTEGLDPTAPEQDEALDTSTGAKPAPPTAAGMSNPPSAPRGPSPAPGPTSPAPPPSTHGFFKGKRIRIDGGKPAATVIKKRFRPKDKGGRFAQRSGTVSTALHLLSSRRSVAGGDAVQHGFKIAENAPPEPKNLKHAVEYAPVRRVQLKDLHATSPHVKRDHVRNFIESPDIVSPGQRALSGQLEDKPVVQRVDGKHYILDGHTRLAAKLLTGQTDAMVRVLEEEPHVEGSTDPTVTTSGASSGYPANAGEPRGNPTPAAGPDWDPNPQMLKGEKIDD